LLPVTIIRCILELPGKIRIFPGSLCNGELPEVCLLTCAPLAGQEEGEPTVWGGGGEIQPGSWEDEPAGQQHWGTGGQNPSVSYLPLQDSQTL